MFSLSHALAGASLLLLLPGHCLPSVIRYFTSPCLNIKVYVSFLRIGAIFTEDQKDSPTELAFKYAVYKINKDPNILSNKTLSYDIQYVPREDSFRTTNKVSKCHTVKFLSVYLAQPL